MNLKINNILVRLIPLIALLGHSSPFYRFSEAVDVSRWLYGDNQFAVYSLILIFLGSILSWTRFLSVGLTLTLLGGLIHGRLGGISFFSWNGATNIILLGLIFKDYFKDFSITWVLGWTVCIYLSATWYRFESVGWFDGGIIQYAISDSIFSKFPGLSLNTNLLQVMGLFVFFLEAFSFVLVIPRLKFINLIYVVIHIGILIFCDVQVWQLLMIVVHMWLYFQNFQLKKSIILIISIMSILSIIWPSNSLTKLGLSPAPYFQLFTMKNIEVDRQDCYKVFADEKLILSGGPGCFNHKNQSAIIYLWIAQNRLSKSDFMTKLESFCTGFKTVRYKRDLQYADLSVNHSDFKITCPMGRK